MIPLELVVDPQTPSTTVQYIKIPGYFFVVEGVADRRRADGVGPSRPSDTFRVSLEPAPGRVLAAQRVQGHETGLAEEETRRFADLEDLPPVRVLGHVRDEDY